jgi:WbqC-like protein family
VIEKKIAIHQPNFMPWLGFFMKVAISDVLVLHDNVQYTKGGPTRRCMIRRGKDSAETEWMTIPLIKHSDFSLLKDLRIYNAQKWQTKHLNKLFNLYNNSPFFNEIFGFIEDLYKNEILATSLCDQNIIIIKELCRILDLQKPMCTSSSMPIAIMESDRYNISIVQFLEGTHYVAGNGSISYQNDNLFILNHIQLVKCDFLAYIKSHPYSQSNQPFLPGLTIIDALMHLGITGTKNYIADFKKSII